MAVAVSTSVLLGFLFISIVLICRTYFPKLFTDEPVVIKETAKLGYLLAITIFLNSIQPVLSRRSLFLSFFFFLFPINSNTSLKYEAMFLTKIAGVAVGAEWLSLVAMRNIACYYLFGLPVVSVLGFKLKLNTLVHILK